MAAIINTNISSINAQRNLSASQNDLATSIQRLSTGLRINSAKDDAAGLAISERMTTQIRGMNQAIRNANDGISFAQTAEGALGAMSDSLQRIRELAVQAANDTNSSSDRQALNNEVKELLDEVSRIAMTTDFNGARMLDGTLGDTFFQIGPNQGQTLSIDGIDTRTSQMGAAITRSIAGGTLAPQEGLTQANIHEDGIASISSPITLADSAAIAATGDAWSDIVVNVTGITSLEDAVREINKEIDDTIAAGGSNAEAVARAGLKAELYVNDAGETSITVSAALEQGAFTVTGGLATLNSGATANVAASTATATNLVDLTVTTRANAEETIAAINGAITQVNDARAEMGAVQSRFESTIRSLSITAENLTAAKSRIKDADFAQETAALTRAQILQQAGTAMLAQANQVPQGVLSLLQG